MNHAFLRSRAVQHVIKWIVALSFALFTFYQIILAIAIETNKVGRLIGIVFYLLLTLASFFVFSHEKKVKNVRSVLLVAGLLLLFVMRLLNVSSVFVNLDFGYAPSVLYCLVYVLSQLGALILPVGYLMTFRTDLTENEERKLMHVLMSVVIALYGVCFIIECVLLVKYGYNIDLDLKFTLISRVLYFLSFAGTAFCLMLPPPKRRHRDTEEYL